MFEGKTVAELNEVLESLKAEIAIAKAREQEQAEREARTSLEGIEKGTPVKVIFKGEEVVAIFEKLTEKRLTVNIDGVNKSVMFNKVVSVG